MANAATPARHARTLIPADIANRLDHLKADLRVPLAELMVEGVILLLRYHGRGAGLPEPMKPVLDRGDAPTR